MSGPCTSKDFKRSNFPWVYWTSWWPHFAQFHFKPLQFNILIVWDMLPQSLDVPNLCPKNLYFCLDGWSGKSFLLLTWMVQMSEKQSMWGNSIFTQGVLRHMSYLGGARCTYVGIPPQQQGGRFITRVNYPKAVALNALVAQLDQLSSVPADIRLPSARSRSLWFHYSYTA